MIIPSILDYTKTLIQQALPLGGMALDGTAGNGHDTLFLAQTIGGKGHVYGFDIQAEAIDSTRARLEAEGMLERVTLIHADHATLRDHLPPDTVLNAAMFNLGYLPHGDKSIITQSDSTLAALSATFDLLVKGGILTVVLYPGHDGGADEANAVLTWTRSLPPEQAQVLWYQHINSRRASPSLLAIEKR